MSAAPSTSAGAAQAPPRVAAWMLLAAVLFLTPTAGGQEATVSIRYCGHSFFLVTAAGLRIAIDPFGEIGYPMPDVEGDVVQITHEHRWAADLSPSAPAKPPWSPIRPGPG